MNDFEFQDKLVLIHDLIGNFDEDQKKWNMPGARQKHHFSNGVIMDSHAVEPQTFHKNSSYCIIPYDPKTHAQDYRLARYVSQVDPEFVNELIERYLDLKNSVQNSK